MGRRPAPPTPRPPRTELQRKRDDALAAAGFTKKDVWQQMRSEGHRYSYQTACGAIDGRFRNDAVIAAFCKLTGLTPLEAFPLDEPPHGRDEKPRRVTRSRRAAMIAQSKEAARAIEQQRESA